MSVTAFTNAVLVCPIGGEIRDRTLLVEDGVITGMGDAPEGATVVDCGGKLLAPASSIWACSRSTPRRLPRGRHRAHRPDADQSPVLDDPGVVQRAALIGRPDLWIHPIAAATRSLAGTDLAEMAVCVSAGAKAVGTGRGWIADSGVMHRVLAYAGDLGLTVISHAEDGGLAADAVATEGETASRLGCPPPRHRRSARHCARLMLAEETGAKLHIRQVTTASGFDLIRAAKRRGVKVTCGITPAHLHLSDIAVTDFRTYARLSPPLRDESDRQAALAAVADGTVDVIGSGHDPHGPESKRLPFVDAEAGMAGGGDAAAAGADAGARRAHHPAAPVRAAGQQSGQGAGARHRHAGAGQARRPDAVRCRQAWMVSGDALASAGNTPFDGFPVQGRALRLWKAGREIL